MEGKRLLIECTRYLEKNATQGETYNQRSEHSAIWGPGALLLGKVLTIPVD